MRLLGAIACVSGAVVLGIAAPIGVLTCIPIGACALGAMALLDD